MANFRKRNGKWQAQVRRQGHRSTTKSFIQRRDAETWARQMESALDKQALPVNPQRVRSLTLGALVERYAAEVTPHKRSAYAEQSRIRVLRQDEIYGVSLALLTPLDIAAFLRRRMKSVCGETARKDGKLLRHIIEVARRNWDVPLMSNPAASVVLPSPSMPRTRRLSGAERQRIAKALQANRSPLLGYAIDLAIETGMRRGEILSVRWEDLSCDGNVLTIPLTKTDIPRTIPLSPSAKSVLDSIRSLGIGSQRILPLSPNALRLSWERMKRRARIEGLRFHDLRHEAISRFFEIGLSVPEVALISGHRDLRMLFRYTHLRPEDVARKLSKTGP